MTKEDLVRILETYIPGTGGEWRQEILEVMRVVHNRTLDDAQAVMEKYDGYYNNHIEDLKIKPFAS